MKKFMVKWETVYGEDYDTNGVDIVEAETADEAKEIVEANRYHTIACNVTEYSEEDEENV